MNKNSDANIDDILNRLRQNVENQTDRELTDEAKPVSTVESPDQILDKLKEHMGNAETDTTSKDFRETDYDISGFEIGEVSAEGEHEPPLPEGSEAEKVDMPVKSAVEEPVRTSRMPQESEGIPQILQEAASESMTTNLKEETVKEVKGSEDAASENTKDFESVIEDEHSEKSELIIADDETEQYETDEPQEPIDEEAVRKRVELFVEKTVDPEEEFDYFAEMDRKAAKIKEKSLLIEEKERDKQEMAESSEATVVTPIIAMEAETTPLGSEKQIPVKEQSELDIQPTATVDEGVSPVTPVLDRASNPFFYYSEEGKGANAQTTAENRSTINVRERLDDTDINLLLALGQKQSIEESVGFVRVREAKNNFYDPTDDEPIGHNVFAYDGQEFRAPEQTEAIKTRYRKEKKTLYKRLIGTMILSLLLLFSEHFILLDLQIPYISDFFASDIRYYLVNLTLTIGCFLLSAKQLLNGARGFFTMRPNQHTPTAILSFVNLFYDAALILFFRGAELTTYNFALSVFLTLSIIGDTIRLTKEMLTFDVISDEKEKFSLEKEDASPEINREKKALYKRDLLVERVSFVGKYFTRTSRRPVAYTEYFIELLVTQVVAIFAAILVAFISKSMEPAINTFMFVLFVCIPMQHLICGIYPLGRLSKILYRHNSAIIGETVDTEYVGANTVYLDDIEMFGHHGVSVSGLRIYNDTDFYDVLYHAHAVFSEVEGPLRYVFENSSHEIQKAENVKLVNIYANGIEALVDSHDKVFIGNINFMRSNGFFPKRNDDDDKKVENGELCILYMTVNGSLCAKFYMKYTVTQRFEKFVSKMNENGTKVGIRTLDPNVTERMIGLLRKDKETEISVIRPTLNDLVPLGRRSDSGIITAKSPHMISRILAQCAYLKKINHLGTWMRVLSMVFGLCAAVILVLADALSKVPSLTIAIYQLIWLIPMLIYTKTKLK